jgi:hypothetical protein
LGKNKAFMEKLFSSKFKMAEKFNMKDNIFFKKCQDFIIEQPLNEMFTVFDMLPSHKIKMLAYCVKNKKCFVAILD